MASDYFGYEAKLGSATIKFQTRDWKFASHIEICSLVLLDSGGVSVKLNNRNSERIMQMIRAGAIELIYTGGYCQSGADWGPDDVACCHCSDDFDIHSPYVEGGG